MPLEFRCSHCQKLLSTPDGTSGKQAKCPACGAVVPIPQQSNVERADIELAETSWHPPGSVAAAPQAMSAALGVATAGQAIAPLVPTQIELGDVLTRTWEIFKQCWGQCIAGTWANVAMMAVAIGLSFVPWAIRQSNEPKPEDIVLWVVVGFVCWWLHLGVLKFMLKLARGEPAAMGDMLSAGNAFLPSLVAGLLFAVALSIGLAFCIVPGIYVMLAGSQFPMLLVDRRTGPLGSLRLSMQITAGNKVTLFLLGILLWGISTAASTITCGLSTIATSPFWFLAMAVSYVMMTGQRTAYVPPATADRPLAPQPQLGTPG
jgi:phage FluMu protein Com